MNGKKGLSFPFLALVFALFPACSGLPKSSPALPGADLFFDHIEASNPDSLAIHVRVLADNPRDEEAFAEIVQSRLFINGEEVSDGCTFESEKTRLPARSTAEIMAVYRLDMKKLKPSLEKDASLIEAKSGVRLGFTWGKGGQGGVESEAVFEFPFVREPEFSIFSIAVLQAELINTRLKVQIRVRNPNPFPITLSSFNYELYGMDYLWGGGQEKVTFTIPENAEAEKNLYIIMNFMDTGRDLLNRVIAMRSVPYRFSGKAEFAAGISYLPVFTTAFDLKGRSEVLH